LEKEKVRKAQPFAFQLVLDRDYVDADEFDSAKYVDNDSYHIPHYWVTV